MSQFTVQLCFYRKPLQALTHKTAIHKTAAAMDGSRYRRLISSTPFPIQKEGRKAKAKENGAGTKWGMTAPSIIREDSFVTAMPSSLLEDTVITSMPMMMPCKVPASDRHRIAPAVK